MSFKVIHNIDKGKVPINYFYSAHHVTVGQISDEMGYSHFHFSCGYYGKVNFGP